MVIELSGVQFELKSFSVISKSNERAAWVRFEITSMISDQNCTTRGSITTLLHPLWNYPNKELGQFKYFIDAGLKIHPSFWGKSETFGNKSCKIFSAIWSVTLNKPCNLIGCFVFSVASSLARKKMRFKANISAIRE